VVVWVLRYILEGVLLMVYMDQNLGRIQDHTLRSHPNLDVYSHMGLGCVRQQVGCWYPAFHKDLGQNILV